MSRLIIPTRYAAWLSGELGKTLERVLREHLEAGGMEDIRIQKMPRGFLVESNDDPGALVNDVHVAVLKLEANVQMHYPVFYKEMGPVWTGTLQVILPTEDA